MVDNGYDSRVVEFSPQKISIENDLWGPHVDGDGSLTGAAFELAAQGLVVPSVIPRLGLSNFGFHVTEEGRRLYEDKARMDREFPLADDNFVFVIMSFSTKSYLIDAYSLGIKPVVEAFNFKCIRVDEIEHNRRITDKVIECIRKARIVIADLTEQRPNCYYELGYAHAINKEVVHLLRKDEPIHFDVQDYNFIIYESTSELKGRLESRMRAIVGGG